MLCRTIYRALKYMKLWNNGGEESKEGRALDVVKEETSNWGSSGCETEYDNDGDYMRPQPIEAQWFKDVNDKLGKESPFFVPGRQDEDVSSEEDDEGGSDEDEDEYDGPNLAKAHTVSEQEIKLRKEGHQQVTRYTIMCERDAGEPFGWNDNQIVEFMRMFFEELKKTDVPRYNYAFLEDEFNAAPI